MQPYLPDILFYIFEKMAYIHPKYASYSVTGIGLGIVTTSLIGLVHT